ncbi:hypothetical protein EVG20_g5452 [Dentipellis fragilis]|uniref:Diphthine--ammonia ligase n=1 Tax=Dentipellis fragilis TaxID=205917 RepID=A0A4Y9YVE6_9AGAM|nr:hypothetical protein EVG20_g5452 [Dentipellis fragilis]
MKYVALLSGGKDSCYNLLHCHRNGHELIAAASLGPGHGKEELDSYLYQTVGQDAIEFVARALDVPLYRRVISGTAVEQGSEYGGRTAEGRKGTLGDETEDLYALLSDVKSQHPDVQGVSVGAILSSYQRVRVEHVCRRLSLTPLCYLWQRDQAELLSEMIAAGMDAILIKVAGIGLTSDHLGKSLAQMQPTLTKLNNLYGSHICGEGGEYETLTLDCPLFKQKIVLLETETVIHSDNDFATVAYMRIKNATLEPKQSQQVEVAVPELLDEEFSAIRNVVAESQKSAGPSTSSAQNPSGSSSRTDLGPRARRIGDWIALGNIHRSLENGSSDISLEEEVRECFQQLQDRLREHSMLLSQIANINIFISDMTLFGSINAVYVEYFGTSPPARACVAVNLPSPIHVVLDCVAYADHKPADRQALHVQGLSYWAPANIGPYSQAILVDDRIFVSGQIGLIPSSLALPAPPSLAMEAALASQHADRVVQALKTNPGGGWDGYLQGLIYWLVNPGDITHLKKAHEETSQGHAPTLFVAVKELPKGALVEKQVLYHTGRRTVIDEDGEPEIISKSPTYDECSLYVGDATVSWEASRYESGGPSFAIIFGKGTSDWSDSCSQLKAVQLLVPIFKSTLSMRMFYNIHRTPPSADFKDLFGNEEPAITPIPCSFISSTKQDDWDYALCIVSA